MRVTIATSVSSVLFMIVLLLFVGPVLDAEVKNNLRKGSVTERRTCYDLLLVNADGRDKPSIGAEKKTSWVRSYRYFSGPKLQIIRKAPGMSSLYAAVVGVEA